MNRLLTFLSCLALLVVAAPVSAAAPGYRSELVFEPNLGQAPHATRFMANGPAVRAAFGSDHATIYLAPRSKPAEAITIRFLNASADVRLSGVDPRVEKRHYLRSAGSVSNVPTYGRVRYENLHPGVDLVFYESQGRLEYDYILQPGAELGAVSFEVSGRAEIDPLTGALRIFGENAEILQHAPRAFQQGQEIEVSYVSKGENRFGFEVGDYDLSAELLIDPIVDYSSYLGAGEDDFANAVAVGEDGSIYVTGRTDSDDFPVSGNAILAQFGGDDADAFVTKLSADGSEILWSTYYGSESTDVGNDIAVNAAGEVYITGWTESENLPVDGFQTQYGGSVDCFVAKLNADGASLAYATYLGHGDEDRCNSIAIDDSGAAYVAGYSSSRDFPVTEGSLQGDNAGGRDAFVAKFAAAGGGRAWITFLGGAGDDTAHALAVDADGVVYVAGETSSADFPLTDDADQNIGGGGSDAFLAKLSSDGSALMYGSFFGGGNNDRALGLALGPQGHIHVVGEAESSNLPGILDPIQDFFGGGDSDAFIAMFDATGANRLSATFFGGNDRDFATDVAVDNAGRIYVVGGTSSSNFRLTDNAVLPEYRGEQDAFIAQFEAAGAGLLQSSYFGGQEDDEARGVAVSSEGRVYIVGFTRSENLPLTDNALQSDFNEDSGFNPLDDPVSEAFVARISPTEGERAFTTVSGASFQIGPVAAGSIVTGFGTGLTDTEESATSLPLPTTLGGVQVRLTDEFGNQSNAELFYASGNQVNFFIPSSLAPGRYEVEVLRDGTAISRGFVQVRNVAPSLFTADMSGSGPAAALVAQRSGDTFTNEPIFEQNAPGAISLRAIDLSAADETVLQLFGTGFGGATDVEVLVDGRPAEVLFSGNQGEFVGLDQINVRLGEEFAGVGETTVQVVADGIASNGVRILLQ